MTTRDGERLTSQGASPMAQDHNAAPTKTAWTKIFSAFKVAFDMKKLILAAAGIFCAAAGWWVLGWTFYSMRTFPRWEDYEVKEKNDPAERKAQWDYFKSKRDSWNLLHE